MISKLIITSIFLFFFDFDSKANDNFDQFYKQFAKENNNVQLQKLVKSFVEKTKNNQDNSSEIYGSLALYYKKKKPVEKLDLLIKVISKNDVPTKELSFIHYLLGKLVMNEFNSFEVSSYEYKTAIDISKKTKNYVVTALSYERLARNYTSIKDWKNAEINFEKAKIFASKTKLYSIEDWLQLYNNTAYAYERNNKFVKARKTLFEIKELLKKVNSSNEMYKKVAFSSKAIELMLNVRQYKTAKYEQKLKDLFQYIMNTQDGAFMAGYVAMGLLESYEFSNNQNVSTLSLVEKLDSYIDYEYELTEKLTSFYLEKKMIDEYVRVSKTLQKKMKAVHQKQEELNHSVLEKFYFKRLKLMNSNYQLKKVNLKTEKSANFYFQFSLVILSLIFLIIVYSLYIKKVNKIKLMQQEQYILEQKEALTRKEFEVMEKEFEKQEQKKKEIELNLIIKNEAEKVFAEELKKLKKSQKNKPEEIISSIQVKVNQLLELDKRSFLNKFESNDKDYYLKKITKKYPQLTNLEQKLVLYFYLKMTTKEISNLLKMTEGSVRVYKNRIRKKLEFDDKTNFSDMNF